MALDQANRTLGLQTPLGENELLLTAFRGEERISQLFRFELDMISDNNAIAPADIVGKNVTFYVKLADDSPRYFNGFVSRFFAGDEDDQDRRNYRAEIVPWMWFLTRTTDCRIFQEKTAVEIIEQILGDLGFSDYDVSQVKGHHPKREYCVQYRESDHNFVSRLCEEEGIFWFFKHEEGKHTLVLADHKGAYFHCEEKEVDYPRDFGTRAMEDHVTAWEHQWEFRTGKVAQTDYNFETPSTNLMTDEQTLIQIPGMDKYEQYDYPGLYGNTDDGRALTRTRMEEEEAHHDVIQAESLCKTFTPGGKFKLRQHRASTEEGKTFAITSIRHTASEPMAYETGTADGFEYKNSFTCIPESVVFRAPRTTRRPFVQGPHTAVVVGASGEDIYPDKYGRVKVQFHWDREGKEDDKSSCWVRVSQNWAGKGWGGMFIPHTGQEVIVDFLEGDPDRPIITGRVYNAEQTVPLKLPANKTKCIIRDHGDNQWMFEGKSQEQFIRFDQDYTEAKHNFFFMTNKPGEEEIRLQDKFGNFLSLDFPNEKIVLHSPTNNSTLTIGPNGFVQKTDFDKGSWTKGNYFAGHVGLKCFFTGGLSSSVVLGAGLSISGGPTASATLGLAYTFSHGAKIEHSKSSTYTIADNDATLESGKSVILDADDDVLVLGGKDDRAMMKAGDKEIVIAFTPKTGARKHPSVPALAGLTAGLVTAGSIASGLIWSENKKSPVKSTGSLTDSLLDIGVPSMIGAAASTSAGVAAGIMAAKKLQKDSDARKAKRPNIDLAKCPGSLKLDDKGVELAVKKDQQLVGLSPAKGVYAKSKNKQVTVEASTKNVVLKAGKNVFINAQLTHITKGKLKHKNLDVKT